MVRPRSVWSPRSALLSVGSRFVLLGGLLFVGSVAVRAGEEDPTADLSSRFAKPAGRLAVLDRDVVQIGGDWQVDYRIRTAMRLDVAADQIAAHLHGTISNARIPDLDQPRPIQIGLSGGRAWGYCPIPNDDPEDDKYFGLGMLLQVWPDDGRATPKPPEDRGQAMLEPLQRDPGELVRVRIRLAYDQMLYGDYDPPLGRPEFRLDLGPASIVDQLPLDQPQRITQADQVWSEPKEDYRSVEYYVSPPDSLHLHAHLTDAQQASRHHYRFDDVPVRYDTPMRLRFSYLIAPGTQTPLSFSVVQSQIGPDRRWRPPLPDGRFEECLPEQGRWVHVERIIHTTTKTNTLRLDFQLNGRKSCIGEAWIDDVSLEPLDNPDPDNP